MRLARFFRFFRRPKPRRPNFPCPMCGDPVRAGSLACRSCGSDAETGWSEQGWEEEPAPKDTLGDFDYDAYLEREFSAGGGSGLTRGRVVMIAVVVLLILGLVFMGR